jgi:CIC family chloride channel protein
MAANGQDRTKLGLRAIPAAITFQPSDLRHLGRTLVLCMLVGVVVGFAACLFHVGVEVVYTLVVEKIARFETPRPFGEAAMRVELAGPVRWWLLPLIPALGGLACGLLTHRFAPEAKGGGGDAMIEAYHRKNAHIRARVPLVKGLASIFILGTGGSAGREGPIMQIGAGFGSWLARLLNTDDRTRRLLLLAGTAAGMSALFRTPLGAALFAIEVLYRDDFESDGIVQVVIASVTAYSVFITVFGQGSHLFKTQNYPFKVATLPLYLAMALVIVAGGRLFVTLLNVTKKIFERWQIPAWLKPAIGGLFVGTVAIVLPQTLGMGYGWLQDAILWTGPFGPGWRAMGLLALVALVKMITTSSTISSGGSGGDFGPSLVIGGLIGAACGQLFHQVFPNLVTTPGSFALVGMATFFGGIAHVPLASLFMVCELSGSYDLLVPLMFSVGVAVLLLRKTQLYHAQVRNHYESPVHADAMAVDVLGQIKVEQAYDKQARIKPVPATLPLTSLIGQVAATRHATFPVCDGEGKLIGMVSLATLRSLLNEEVGAPSILLVNDAMDRLVTVAATDSLSVALERLLKSGYSEIPVVDAGDPAQVGLIGYSDIVGAYNRELTRRKERDKTIA